MALPADVSLMDILFDRDDPVLKIMDDKEIFKGEQFLNAKLDNWTNDDDILTDILANNDLNSLDNELNLDCQTDDVWEQEIKSEPVYFSDCYSDSGYSNGQQSPGSGGPPEFELAVRDQRDDDDDDQTSSTISTTSDSSLNHHLLEDEPAFIESTCSEPPRKKVRQVMKVSPMLASSPRSVLLPVNTTSGVRTFKIVSPPGGLKTIKPLTPGTQVVIKSVKANAAPIQIRRSGGPIPAINRVRPRQKVVASPSAADSDDDIQVVSEDEEARIYDKQQYPRLMLSIEERKLMLKEGVSLPTHYPLTKFEERELKRIRRKIRNKISAQDSRKRKKEYLDGLEDRVRQCTQENMSLVRKIKYLQSHNQSLVAQLKKLQAALAAKTAKTAQPATCLLVLILSVALVMAPNLRLSQPTEAEIAEQDATLAEKALPPLAGRTRSLLSSETVIEDELLSMGIEQGEIPAELHELLKFHESESSSGRKSSVAWADAPHFLADHDYGPSQPKRRMYHIDEKLTEPEVDEVWPPPKMDKVLQRKQLVVPDVDDEWLPKSGNGGLLDKIEVKVNISDSIGTRTVVIKVPKESQ